MKLKKIGDWYNDNKKEILPFLIILGIVSFTGDILTNVIHKPTSVTYREWITDLEAGMDKFDEDGNLIEVVPDIVDTVYYADSDYWRYTKWTPESRKAYEEWIAEGKNEADFEYKYSDKEYYEFEMPDYTADVLHNIYTTKYDGIACREIKKKDFQPFIVKLFPVFGSTFLLFTFLFVFLGFYSKKMKSIGGIEGDLLVKDTGIRFNNVIGHNEVIQDLQLVVALMKQSRVQAEKQKKHIKDGKSTAMDRFGAKIPRGMLFSGPPGTGKTLLAKAIAGEAGVPFLYMNASGFVEQYVGVGAKRVRQLFKMARKNAPCIIFLDEIDAVGTDRSAAVSGEQKQTINALLQEMDGFDTKEGIFIIAATNAPDTLDKALVRSGRFDRQVVINPPKDAKTRKQIFELYLEKEIRENLCDADIDHIAKETIGFTGADINAACNEARLIAITKDADRITTDIMEEAIDRKVFKGNRTKHHNEKFLELCSRHEAGHALMDVLLNLPISRATIIGNTNGNGGGVFREDPDSDIDTKEGVERAICTYYGGRAAEEWFYGKSNITTGASKDIQKASSLLDSYIKLCGFDEEIGMISIESGPTMIQMPSALETQIMQRKKYHAERLYHKTMYLIKTYHKELEKLAKALQENETMTGDEVYQVLGFKPGEKPVVFSEIPEI